MSWGKAPTTIEARLSALSNQRDYLASSGVLGWSPFKAVRGPRVSQREGQTPVLEPEMVRALLDSFEGDDVVTLWERAIVSTMLFSFARVGAVTKFEGRHYEQQGLKASLLLMKARQEDASSRSPRASRGDRCVSPAVAGRAANAIVSER